MSIDLKQFEGHTPGPWKAWDRGIGWEVHDANGNELNRGMRETFSESDAKLLAASPDLLAEVQRLRKLVGVCEEALQITFDESVDATNYPDGPNLDMATRTTVGLALKAIKEERE